MQTGPDISVVAALIGDPARAAILSALLDGQSLPAGELAYRAYITPQTTSTHLAKLVAGGLLEARQVGRHRYYRLKNAQVAHVLEALLAISPPTRLKSQRTSPEFQALCFARTCYDHLAGKLGVAVTQAFMRKGLVISGDRSYLMTPEGSAWLAAHNIDEDALRKRRRSFARACLDWSERQDHLAGSLGAAIAGWFMEHHWVQRVPDSRSLQLTRLGREGLRRELQIEMEQ